MQVAPFAALGLNALGALLAPTRCAACDAPTGWLSAFCSPCASMTEPMQGTRDGVAAFRYGGSIAHAVARLKYEGRPDLGRPLGDLLARALDPPRDSVRGARARFCVHGQPLALASTQAVVVPVPLHPRRLAERGYNQSALVAARVARSLRLPMWTGALERTRTTRPQATLDRAARWENLRGAFRVHPRAAVRGHPILLVDDVRTTGATLDACAMALRLAGAGAIGWAVVASSTTEVDETMDASCSPRGKERLGSLTERTNE